MRRQEGFSICEVRVINIKIGNTPYEVEIHFSDKNKETMEDKLKGIILNEDEKKQ